MTQALARGDALVFSGCQSFGVVLAASHVGRVLVQLQNGAMIVVSTEIAIEGRDNARRYA